jgi:adenylate cyclase
MGLQDFLVELNDEIRILTSTDFSLDVVEARLLPSVDDPSLTFENFDAKSKAVKVIETCVLYVDIRRSTQLSLQHYPKTLSKLYSSFVRGAIRCADFYGGGVRNIIGDRIMVLFDPNGCFKNAVNTAILINTFAKYILNRHFKQNEVTCGIGIDHGKMLVTKTGTIKKGSERSEYRSLVWLGTPANVASKLTDIANKSIPRSVINIGKHYPFTNQWTWHEKEIEEFFEGLEMTYSQPIIARFKEPFVQSFFRSITYQTYKPILLTEAVYRGFVRECPDDPSIREKWWQGRKISVEGYDGMVYEGDIIFRFGRDLT